MTVSDLLSLLRESPVVASVQAGEGSPLADPAVLVKLAEASALEGVKVLRVEGVPAIRAIKAATGFPVIGLIKRRYEGSSVYITPTEKEVQELARVGCEIIAIDGTGQRRPKGSLADLVDLAHKNGQLVMADCDTPESAEAAIRAGADLIGTTLSGYTPSSIAGPGPDLELIRRSIASGARVVLAEGRFTEPWQVRAAIQIGAKGVVIGGAINDPIKQTRRFARAADRGTGDVGAVDLGGTWLRFGIFSRDWEMKDSWKIERPASPQDRLDWIARQVSAARLHRVGVSSGGVVNPATGSVVKAKDIIPNHVGTRFDRQSLGATTYALNDGLATAWGHACHPRFAGKRVATLALGTGVGYGLVDRGRILMGPLGEPPHLNDLPFGESTVEAALGGAFQTDPERAASALRHVVAVVNAVHHPEAIVVCGSVGLSEPHGTLAQELGLYPSPFGEDAGLYGAAALALFPPEL